MEELLVLEKQHANVTVTIALSEPSPDWLGEKGHFSRTHLNQISEFCKRQFFVCGPDGFMRV